MKKMIILISLLLSGCSFNFISNKESSSNNEEVYESKYAYVHYFLDDSYMDLNPHYTFFTDGHNNISSFSVGESEASGSKRINFKDYGINDLIGGDSIQITHTGDTWITSLFPSGDASIFGKLIDVKYYPAEIYEVTMSKEVNLDVVNIGFSSLYEGFTFGENDFVVSKDEEGNFIKRSFESYDDGTRFYYAHNTLMEDSKKYSFLYDFKIR